VRRIEWKAPGRDTRPLNYVYIYRHHLQGHTAAPARELDSSREEFYMPGTEAR
jgi:hypothetical protein